MNLYCGVESFPEYCSIRLEDNVVDGTGWEINSHNDDYSSLTMPKSAFSGNVGDIILVRDDYGIAVPLTIENIDDTNSDVVNISTSEVDEDAMIIEAVEFSGYGDFSYLSNNASSDANESDGTAAAPIDAFNMYGQPVMMCASMPAVAMAEWFETHIEETAEKTAIQVTGATPSANIDITVQYRENEQGDGRFAITPRINGAFFDPKIGKGYKKEDLVPSDEDRGSVDFTDGADITDNINLNIDSKVKGTIRLKNLSVTADGYFEWLNPGDEKNRVNVYVNSDIECNLEIKSGIEGRFKLVTIPVPIASTGGSVSVDITFYMVIGLDGSVKFTYEIEGGHVGIEVSVADKTVTPVKSCKSKNFDVEANVSLEAGVRAVVDVNVCNKYDLCDPYVEIKAGASAETLEKKEGFENLPPCVALKLYCPLIRVGAHYGESTFAYKMLNFIGWASKDSFEIIDADKAYRNYWGKQLHVEFDENGKLTAMQGGEEVCTHVKKEELEEKLKEKAEDEIDDIKDEAERRLLDKVEEMLEEWLEKNCGGC